MHGCVFEMEVTIFPENSYIRNARQVQMQDPEEAKMNLPKKILYGESQEGNVKAV